MDERWADAEDTEGAFPSDWLAQCDAIEADAIDEMPAWTHASLRAKASFWLWIGVYAPNDVPRSHIFKLNAVRRLVCEVGTQSMGALVDDANGNEVDGLDAFAIVRCAEVRRLLARAKR